MLAAFPPTHASLQDATQQPPKLSALRYDEDYSYLAGAQRAAGHGWQSFAYMPLDEKGESWIGTGVELRLRYESYRNDNWSPSPDADHDYLWWRALPYVSWNHANMRAFVELIFAGEEGDEAGVSPIAENHADVLQAFAEINTDGTRPLAAGRGIDLRVGRQLLSFGSERLLGPRYRPNVLKPFDAVRASTTSDGWKFDALVGRPAETNVGTFDDSTDDTRSLWLFYATHAPGADHPLGLDLYTIGFHDDHAEYEAGSGKEDRTTLGTRLFGAANGWDWNFELFGQFGRFAGDDVRAWSVASDTGHSISIGGMKARVGAKCDVISGDRNAGDGRLETFNPLFPKGRYFGEIGLLGPYNLIDLHPSVTLALDERWSLELGTVLYWRESTGDGLYDNGGNLIRASSGSNERYAGTQFDAILGWQLDRNVDVSLTGSYFAAGPFLKDSGASRDVAYSAIELRFRY